MDGDVFVRDDEMGAARARCEQQFLEAIERVTRYRLDGRSLTLVASDQPVLELAC
jgi:hypothetical protein